MVVCYLYRASTEKRTELGTSRRELSGCLICISVVLLPPCLGVGTYM